MQITTHEYKYVFIDFIHYRKVMFFVLNILSSIGIEVQNMDRKKATQIVKSKLKTIKDVLNEGKIDVFDQVQSYSTSLIKVNQDKTFSKDDRRILRVIQKKYDREVLVKKYLIYISVLESTLENLIIDKHFYGLTTKELYFKYNINFNAIYEYLQKSYSIIAMLDDDIDFKIDDYIKYYLKDHKLNTTIKNTVILMLKKNSALDENDNNRIYMDSILNQIDNKLLQITNKYIQDESFVQSRNEYRSISRAIYTIAYLHKDIDFNQADYQRLMKNTGWGYQKYLILGKKKLSNAYQEAFKKH